MNGFYILVVLLAIVGPTIILIARKFFGKSIIYKMIVYLIIFSIIIVLAAFYSGQHGVIHLTWAFPLSLLILFIGIRDVYRNIHMPLIIIQESINRLSNGDIHFPFFISEKSKRDDELSRLSYSVQTLQVNLQKYATLASEIGKGNLDFELPVNKSNVIGWSLNTMRINQKRILREIQDVVNLAGHEGQLSVRVQADTKGGVWAELGDSVNDLLESISKPFMELDQIIMAMADGDLTKRFDGQAEGNIKNMTQNLNNALDALNELLLEVRDNADVVKTSTLEILEATDEMNTSTHEIASAISEMSVGAQSQVSKVDESSNLVEGVLTSSGEMGEQAEEINAAAQNSTSSSEVGLKMVQKVGFSMKDIVDFANETNDSIKSLTDRSDEISKVLTVITDIASQTNLLALNAAIEAAQAGEAGRGFAVVAEEIRKLAEDSRKSAKEIELLITAVQNDTEKTAQALKVMNMSIEGGEAASKDASEAFKEIAASTSQTLQISENILNASRAQIDDIRNVVAITEGVVVIAEETAAGTEEIASSASELSSGMTSHMERAEKVVKIVDQLESQLNNFRLADRKGVFMELSISNEEENQASESAEGLSPTDEDEETTHQA